MNSFGWVIIAVLLGVAAWLAWRYFKLLGGIHELTSQIKRDEKFSESSRELGELASAVNARLSTFDLRLSTSNKERARLSTILDQLTDGVLIADAEGLVQFANPAARKLFGSNAPTGRSVAEVVRNFHFIEAWKKCQQAREMQVEAVEFPAQRRFLQLVVIPDEHEGGSLLLIQDLTRVRRLETVRRDFISNVSHELRTPLASLKALTETLQDGALSDPEAAPRFLGRIHTEVDALTQMAQELLDLSRIESGQVELNFAPLLPKPLLLAAMDRMKAQAERAGLKISVMCDDGLPSIHADHARLEQVLVNLIHNAVKFTRPGGEIALGAQPASGGVPYGDCIRFAVRDTGIGIPAESLPRIFERFYRADKSRAGSGTGLGLSISKHIVEAHGGKIWAESEEGKGSTFYFEIPAI